MEWQQTAECMEERIESTQAMHRLNVMSEILALADYCRKHKLQTEFITKEEHDTFIDPKNSLGAWVLTQEEGIRLKITSKSGEVIFTLRIDDELWHDYAEHVADWESLVENSKTLFVIPKPKTK